MSEFDRVRIDGGPPGLSAQATRVLDIAEDALNLFVEKNRDYGETGDHLGSRGQYADMHRKMGKLKRHLWDGHPLTSESAEEICMDLIGHCLLTIDFLRAQR